MKDLVKNGVSTRDRETIEWIRSEWSDVDAERVVAITSTRPPRNWAKIREAVLSGRMSECSVCGSEIGIQIHHRDGNEANNTRGNLMPLCNKCHDRLPVAPFGEELYCQVIYHSEIPFCLRGLGANKDASTCEFFSSRHGCLLRVFGAVKEEERFEKRKRAKVGKILSAA